MGARKAAAERLYRIGGEAGAEPRFDVADPYAAVGSRDRRGPIQPLGKGRHAGNRLQRVLRRHQPPDLVYVEALQRLPADMQVPAMRRVEGAAEQADAPSRNRRIKIPSPAARERGNFGWGPAQGRTWPLPRTRYL